MGLNGRGGARECSDESLKSGLERNGLCDDDGGIAQLGEHLLCKQGVIGSSPIISTRVDRDGPIAQLARAHD